MKQVKTYNTGICYPFAVATLTGFLFMGTEHTTDETITVYLNNCANLAARHILYNEPYVSYATILDTVKRATGKIVDYGNYWEMVQDKLTWYHETYDV